MELQRYFPDLDDSEAKIGRNPFSGINCVENLTETTQDDFLELRNDSFAIGAFEEELDLVLGRDEPLLKQQQNGYEGISTIFLYLPMRVGVFHAPEDTT